MSSKKNYQPRAIAQSTNIFNTRRLQLPRQYFTNFPLFHMNQQHQTRTSRTQCRPTTTNKVSKKNNETETFITKKHYIINSTSIYVKVERRLSPAKMVVVALRLSTLLPILWRKRSSLSRFPFHIFLILGRFTADVHFIIIKVLRCFLIISCCQYSAGEIHAQNSVKITQKIIFIFTIARVIHQLLINKYHIRNREISLTQKNRLSRLFLFYATSQISKVFGLVRSMTLSIRTFAGKTTGFCDEHSEEN